MPRKRMIDPSFWRDEKIGRCSYMERLLFEGLWTFADDNGVGRASPLLIKADVFPYDTLREADIEKALQKLASLGMILLYEREGQRYYFVLNFKKHQVINKPSPSMLPTPLPEDYGSTPVAVTSEEKRSRREVKLKEEKDSAEPETVSTPPVAKLPLNDGTFFSVSVEQCQEWAGLYPAVDVIQQLREMYGWLDANPDNRKTRRGIKAFIVRWLAKEQDKGGAARKKPTSTTMNKSAWGYVE